MTEWFCVSTTLSAVTRGTSQRIASESTITFTNQCHGVNFKVLHENIQRLAVQLVLSSYDEVIATGD